MKKQIFFSTILKFLNVVANFLLIPLMYNTLPSDSFGFWITILSFTGWISLMDVGIGLGLRNNLTIAILNKDYDNAKQLITTTYLVLILISCVIFLFSLFFLPFLNLSEVFKVNSISTKEINLISLVIILSTCINFILSIVNQLYHSVQLSAFASLIAFFSNLFFLVLVYIFVKLFQINLLIISLLYFIASLFSGILVTYIFFRKFSILIPKLRYFNKYKIKNLLQIGGNFFIIQISMLILYSTDNFLIAKFYGSSAIANYSIAFKLYSSVSLLAGLLMTPLWSAYSKAYHQNDYIFINNMLRIQNRMMLFVILFIYFLFIYSDDFISLWIKKEIIIPIPIKVALSAFTLLNIWNGIYSNLLNGLGKTKLQMVTSLFAIIFNIPLCFLFSKYFNLGIPGILYASTLCMLLFSVLSPFEVRKYITKH
jgi:O-antigen/teichoic acid export membrane protein